jgi:nucleotide-binding universal stress UspA family protein
LNNTTMTILLAVDGSKYTKRMLNYIVSNELMFSPSFRYVLVHADNKRLLAPQDDPEHALDAAARFLESHGFKAKRMRRKGAPVDVLIQASKDLMFNLIVMGSRGQSAVKSAVLGSVTAGILERTAVPLLVIR